MRQNSLKSTVGSPLSRLTAHHLSFAAQQLCGWACYLASLSLFLYYKVEISPNPPYDCENKHLMSEVLSPHSGSWQVASKSLTWACGTCIIHCTCLCGPCDAVLFLPPWFCLWARVGYGLMFNDLVLMSGNLAGISILCCWDMVN